MSVRPAPLARPAPVAGRPLSLRGLLEREGAFSWIMLAPGVLFLLAFVAYPFFYGIYLSLQDRPVARAGVFVGLANFATLLGEGVFWQVTRNTFLYTIVTTVLKLLGGLAMALVMNQTFRGRNLARAFLLLPFIVPTILSTIAWMWIFDPTFSVINWTLVHTGAISKGFSWLGNATLAMVAIIIVNTWRGIPFYGITLLARSLRVRSHRRRHREPTLLARDHADHQAHPHHRDHVLDHLHLRGLPDRLRAHPRRAGERHASVRYLRVRSRHVGRSARHGRGGRPHHVARAHPADHRAHVLPEA